MTPTEKRILTAARRLDKTMLEHYDKCGELWMLSKEEIDLHMAIAADAKARKKARKNGHS